MEGECLIRGAQSTDEVIFERLNCSFGSVYAVIVWFNESPFTLFLVEVVFKGCDGVAVSDVYLGFESFVF